MASKMNLAMMSRSLLTILLPLVAASPLCAGDTWPQFRGPGSLGTSDDEGLPDTWSRTENVAWRTEIPGMGWSSPIVWGEKVFLTTAISEGDEEKPKKGLYFGGERLTPSKHMHRFVVYCVDWNTGDVRWQRLAQAGPPRNSRHIKNSQASETPCTDGERVYAYFGNIGLLNAYDLDGEFVWSRQWETYRTRFGWGTAASPIVHEGRVYIVNDNEENSFIEAIDAKTGKKIWRRSRDEKSNWSTPYLWKNDRRTEIVTTGTGKVRSYDLDGEVLWELRGMSSITIPTPFEGFGMLYIASGYVLDPRRPTFAIRPGATGDITLKKGETTNESIVWCQKQSAPYNPSQVLYGDQLYVLLDRGFFTSYDAKTGKPIYPEPVKQRISREANAFTASPWAYDGKVFCLSEDGDTFVIQTGPEFKVLRKNSLDELCMATPAIAHGSLIIRTGSALYRIGGG